MLDVFDEWRRAVGVAAPAEDAAVLDFWMICYFLCRVLAIALLPRSERKRLIERFYSDVGASEPPPAWVLRGELSHKSQSVFEALLSSYNGSYTEVLKHVQVERYTISRRYRVGAVTTLDEIGIVAARELVGAALGIAGQPDQLEHLPRPLLPARLHAAQFAAAKVQRNFWLAMSAATSAAPTSRPWASLARIPMSRSTR